MSLVTVLIEDSWTIREALIPALDELAGAVVVAIAETADEGIAALIAHADRWQLAIVDMQLRSGTGMDVLRAIGPRRAGQHVLVLTNYATPVVRKRAKEAGADAVFDKSTEVDQLFAACQAFAPV